MSTPKSQPTEPKPKPAGKPKQAIIVYCGGFLTPEGRVPYTLQAIPPHTTVIPVFPSGVASIHDRVMHIFYELKGGQVRYGKEHSAFHGHDDVGPTFDCGKYPIWDAAHPISIVGHSFGGVTALALANYLADGDRFEGHHTSADWITSVTLMNSPLNGSLYVYSLGANESLTPVVRWASVGCLLGWLSHILEFLHIPCLQRIYDFKLEHWQLKFDGWRLLHGWLGFCVHSTTDNSAYDMTIQSSLYWGRYIRYHPNHYYLKVASTTYEHAGTLGFMLYTLPRLFLRTFPRSVLHIDTRDWLLKGFDGLLSYSTQSAHRLLTQTGIQQRTYNAHHDDAKTIFPGISYIMTTEVDHLGLVGFDRAMHDSCLFALAAEKARSRWANKDKLRISQNVVDSNREMRPDMQRPNWTVSDRLIAPVVPFKRAVAFVCIGLAISIHPSLLIDNIIARSQHNTGFPVSALIFAALSMLSNSWTVELCSTITKIVWICLSLSTEGISITKEVYIWYHWLRILDVISLVINQNHFENVALIPRALLTIAFSSVLTDNHSNFHHVAAVLVVLDLLNFIANFAWAANYALKVDQKWLLVWNILWTAFLSVLGLMLYIMLILSWSTSLSVESLPTMSVLWLAVITACDEICNMSDAYQVFAIQLFYSQKFIAARRNRA